MGFADATAKICVLGAKCGVWKVWPETLTDAEGAIVILLDLVPGCLLRLHC